MSIDLENRSRSWEGKLINDQQEAANKPVQPTISQPSRAKDTALSTDPASQSDKVRSTWLDKKLGAKGWTSDLEIENYGGPAYNTIKRYRSGKKSTRDTYVRQKFAEIFGCKLDEVPK